MSSTDKFQWVQLTSFNEFNWQVSVKVQLLLGHPPKGPTLPRQQRSGVKTVRYTAGYPSWVLGEFANCLWSIWCLQAHKNPPHHLALESWLMKGVARDGCRNCWHPAFKIIFHPGSWGVTCEDKSKDIQGKIYCYHTTHRVMDSHFNWFHSGEKCWHIRFKKQNLTDLTSQKVPSSTFTTLWL